MTETHGYLCPNCLSWWTCYLNKNGVLLCGCGVKIIDSAYLYRKTYGNQFFGISSKTVRVKFKGVNIQVFFRAKSDSQIEIEAYVYDKRENLFDDSTVSVTLTMPILYKNWQLRDVIYKIISQGKREGLFPHKNFLYIAIKKAFTEASSRGNYWERCHKCENHKGGRKCQAGHTWLSTSCTDFKLRRSIKQFLMKSSEASPCAQ